MNKELLNFLRNKVFYIDNRLLRDICVSNVDNDDISKIKEYISKNYNLIIKEDKIIFNLTSNVVVEFYEWIWENIDLFTIQPEEIKEEIDYLQIMWFLFELSCLLDKKIFVCMEWEKHSLLEINSCKIIKPS